MLEKVMAGSSSSSRISSVFKPQNIRACQGATLTWLCRVKKSTLWLPITVLTMTSIAKFHHGRHQHCHHLCKASVFNQHSHTLSPVNCLVSDFLPRLPLLPAVPSPLGCKVLPFHLPTAHWSFHPLYHVEVLQCQSLVPHPNAGPTVAVEQVIWMLPPQDGHHTSVCLQLLQTIPQMLLHEILTSPSPLISVLHHSLKLIDICRGRGGSRHQWKLNCGLPKLEHNPNVSQLDGLDGMAEPVPELVEGTQALCRSLIREWVWWAQCARLLLGLVQNLYNHQLSTSER